VWAGLYGAAYSAGSDLAGFAVDAVVVYGAEGGCGEGGEHGGMLADAVRDAFTAD